VGDDTLHLIALDDTADAYTYRGFALYLDDGTLFAVYGQPAPIAAKAEPSASFLVLDIKLAQGQAEISPSATPISSTRPPPPRARAWSNWPPTPRPAQAPTPSAP
jgi:hypothetical protein